MKTASFLGNMHALRLSNLVGKGKPFKSGQSSYYQKTFRMQNLSLKRYDDKKYQASEKDKVSVNHLRNNLHSQYLSCSVLQGRKIFAAETFGVNKKNHPQAQTFWIQEV